MALVLWSAQAQANPLGLSNGDVIQFLEFDALQSVSGDGASYSTGSGLYVANGRITSLTTTTPQTINQSAVDLYFELSPTTETVTPLGGTNFAVNVVLDSPSGGAGTDWYINEGGVNILFGHFAASSMHVTGNIDISNPTQVLTIVGLLNVDGGNSALVAAVGGVVSVILGTATVFDFSPTLATLYAGDNTAFNDNFSTSLSGLLTPLNTAPFTVPEPSTALLVGGGLIGLLGAVRRARS